MESARSLYQRFRGAVAKRTLRVGVRFGGRWLTTRGKANIDIPESLAIIGHVSAIEYDAIYDGKTTKARHAFAPGSRPLLVVGTQRGQAFLIGQGFKFTDRGFLDFDTHGRAVELSEKTGKVKVVRE